MTKPIDSTTSSIQSSSDLDTTIRFSVQWISVKDDLPKNDALCVIWNYKRPCTFLLGIYFHGFDEWMHHDYSKVLTWPLEVTHWFPVPELPR